MRQSDGAKEKVKDHDQSEGNASISSDTTSNNEYQVKSR